MELYWEYNPHRMILNKATDIYLCNGDEERVEIEDDKLYRVVTDFYSSQMLAGVTDLSFGLLKLEPKYADGTLIENFEDAIIMAGDQELIKKIEKISEKVITKKLENQKITYTDLKIEITKELNNFIKEETGRKPIVLPIILNIKK